MVGGKLGDLLVSPGASLGELEVLPHIRVDGAAHRSTPIFIGVCCKWARIKASLHLLLTGLATFGFAPGAGNCQQLPIHTHPHPDPGTACIFNCYSSSGVHSFLLL